MIGKLIVRVYRAEGLASADMNGKSDPFIKMTLVNQHHRSSTQFKTLNPVWNEMFEFKIYDIHNHIDFMVYDEDRHGEDFLGRIVIPLLSIKNKKMIWYQLKDRKLQNFAKGRILLRMDLEWSIIKACIRTFNPLEELVDPPAPVIKRSLMVSNFIRAKTQIMILVEILKYIKSCYQWEHKLRSLNAFVFFVVVTYYFELWMLPLFLLTILSFNLCIIKSPKVRDLLGFDEAKFSMLSDIRYINEYDDLMDYPAFKGSIGAKEVNNNNNNNNNVNNTQNQGFCNSIKASCSTFGSGTSFSSGTSSNSSNLTPQESIDNRTIVERIQAGKDVVIMIQDITGSIASYLERISNTFTFKIPFLSYLMMFCLTVATILLYFVPLRYIILAWGINKFTKKIRSPNAIDNNELIDFLSRVPDNSQCIKQRNVISL